METSISHSRVRCDIKARDVSASRAVPESHRSSFSPPGWCPISWAVSTLSGDSRVAIRVHSSHVCCVLSKICSRTEMKSEMHPVLRLAPPSGPYGEGLSQQELPLGQRGRLANLLDLHGCP